MRWTLESGEMFLARFMKAVSLSRLAGSGSTSLRVTG